MNSPLTLEEGVAGAWMGTKDPKLMLPEVQRPILSKLSSYPIRGILMSTWTFFFTSPLLNYLTNCQEPEALASVPQM